VLNEEYKQRIQNILNIYSGNSLFPDLKKGANTCPECHKRNKFYLYDTGVKCFSTKCSLNKFKDIINFYAYRNNYSYNEALLELENNAGINNSKIYDERNEFLTHIISIYNNYLFSKEGKVAINYLKKRGFLSEFLETYMIGYAPSFNLLKLYDVDKTLLKKHNLVDEYGNDYFRNRIIFPIYSRNNKLVHLNGRYINDIPKDDTGEDLISRYKCSKTYKTKITQYLLFENNLNNYKNKKTVILTEGCTDSFTLYQYGIPVLGMLGIEKLSSHYFKFKDLKQIICVFDNDRFPLDHPIYPNQYKSWSRILPELINLQHMLPNLNFKVWMVPPELGKDINDYFLNYSYKKAIKNIYNSSIDLLDFLIEEYKYDFSKHIELAKLCKLKDKDLSILTEVIPKDYSCIDYLMKLV